MNPMTLHLHLLSGGNWRGGGKEWLEERVEGWDGWSEGKKIVEGGSDLMEGRSEDKGWVEGER